MKNFTSIFASALLMVSSAAFAQGEEMAESISGYFRLENPSFGDVLTIGGRYDIKGDFVSPTNAGNVIQVVTDRYWSFAEEMEKLDPTDPGYMNKFMELMQVHSWKGGYYPVKSLKCQGVDYVEMIKKLPAYCEDAIEAYLNEEVDKLYEEHYGDLLFLCAVANDFINPSNISTKETFRAWAERYLTRWFSVGDFNIYLQTVVTTPDDEEGIPQPTGSYYLTFKTPCYIGSMQKAQTYYNNTLNEDNAEAHQDKLDVWQSAKDRILRQVAKDYPEGSDAYNFLHSLLGNSLADMVYLIGESEEGGLYIQPLPDTFGQNGVTLTAEDIMKCEWKFNKVDADQPFAIAPQQSIADAANNYYTTAYTAFPYQIQSPGMKAYYVTEVSDAGEPTLVEIADGKVPAFTGVVIKSNSAAAQDNVVLPLEEEVAPVTGNVLTGTLFANANVESAISLKAVDGNVRFAQPISEAPANSAYYVNPLFDGISTVTVAAETSGKVYDLQGHLMGGRMQKGVYVVNGKKVIF